MHNVAPTIVQACVYKYTYIWMYMCMHSAELYYSYIVS